MNSEVIPQRRSPAEHSVAVGALQRGRPVHDGVGLELSGAGEILITGHATIPGWKMCDHGQNVKTVYRGLCKHALAAKGSQDTGSRNQGAAFFTIPFH